MKREARRPARAQDASAVHLWLVLWKAFRAVEAHAYRSLVSKPIGPSDFAVLEVLLHKGPLPVNAIGRKVQLTSGSTTTAVDRLEAQGFVERKAHATDRRTRVVHLTTGGETLIRVLFAQHARDMLGATAALSAPERATLVRLLKKLGLEAERSLGAAEGEQGPGDQALNHRRGAKLIETPT